MPAGKIEVAEAFSYGCPACAGFHPLEKQLKAALPGNAQCVYMHASFNSAESWRLFQRAYLTAQALGIAAKTHDALFDAIWKTGEPGAFAPVIDRNRCEGKGHCAAVCPKNVFVLGVLPPPRTAVACL